MAVNSVTGNTLLSTGVRIGVLRALNRHVAREFNRSRKDPSLGQAQAEERSVMTVWIYDQDEELKVFATEDAARAWIEKNDPEGVAFEY